MGQPVQAAGHPENHFAVAAGGIYDLSVVPAMPAWREVRMVVARELSERADDVQPLTPPRISRMTWAARAENRPDRGQDQAW
jgi:hypothetical protein